MAAARRAERTRHDKGDISVALGFENLNET
jgi:hypothetical protein